MAKKKKEKGRGDAVWVANRTRGHCGLSGAPIRGLDRYREPRPGRSSQAGEAHRCLYLKCDGDEASPSNQIVGRLKVGSDSDIEQVTPDGRQFRSVPTGRHRCKRGACQEEYNYWQRFCNAALSDGKACRAPTGPVFKWQEGRPTGRLYNDGNPEIRWHDVKVWEQAVIAEEAIARGFHVPTMANGEFRETVAEVGERVIGHAHTVSETPESPLADIARAGMTPEELGEAVPDPTPEEEGPGASRFGRLILEDTDGDSLPDNPNDPGIMRFGKLDLD